MVVDFCCGTGSWYVTFPYRAIPVSTHINLFLLLRDAGSLTWRRSSLIASSLVLTLVRSSFSGRVELFRRASASSLYFCSVVPIQTRYPEDNVVFEMTDIIHEETRYENSSVDVVHARSCDMVVSLSSDSTFLLLAKHFLTIPQARNYARLIQEAARILTPGGIFFSGEFTNAVFFHPSVNADPNTHAPHLCRFFSTMTDALDRVCNIPQITGTTIPQLLESTGLFDNINVQTHAVPLGDWMDDEKMKEIGKEMRKSVSELMKSTEELIRATQLLTQDQMQGMVRYAEGDLNNVSGLVLQYCTTCARRRG
jgi:SAM-dependent methyltransferase